LRAAGIRDENVFIMKTAPALMLFGAISSAMFADSSVKPHIARLGKICVAVFSVLFTITEIWSLLT
jgi:hypothetical protein